MKIEQNLFITDIDEYMKGNYLWCFTLSGIESADGWVKVGQIEVDTDTIDRKALVRDTLAELEKAEEKLIADHAEKLAALRQKRQELLALEAPAAGERA